MADNNNRRDPNRRTVLQTLGAGALGTLGVSGASDAVEASPDSSTHYHNELYGQHFPDPTIHRDESGTWWAYGTNMDRDDGADDSEELLVPILRSDDLHDWTYVGEAFDSRPGWTYGSVWAPDIHYDDGEWVMFYSLEPRPWESGEFGIGLAKSDTPDGPFTDYGQVLGDEETGGGTIDGYFVEYGGTPYLFWGSFQGIFVAELTADLRDWKPATRQQVAGEAYEGSTVFYRDGYWYLFVATGTCCGGYDSTYEVEVGRSPDFFGPYIDPSGTDLRTYDEHNAGIAQLTGNDRFPAPGHGDVTVDDAGDYWFVYHAYDRDDAEFIDGVPARQFFLDRLEWTDDGWPIIGGDKTPSLQSPLPNAGDSGAGAVPNGIYRIENVNSGKPMAVTAAGTDDGDTIEQSAYDGGAHQHWWVEHVGGGEYRLMNQNSWKALDVPDGSLDDGERLTQWAWWTGTMQKWRFIENDDGTVRIENHNSGAVIDVADASMADGADIVQWSWNGGDQQRWTLSLIETIDPTTDGRPW
ncbi:family 43 glycosylhydrolase [Natrialba asiatica]|uniref:Glycoside hydrolase family 43 n=1 Tax=Natrialba asiatica (strain ATCC 700177 / DSM 12278 / JCM 9576 / FERM P-10747 / NBRC 102637 / 172P1) TaxID=29540 RepID=M0B6E4_NATA1|nr:family 43 glycosylhydrolase [Natrialba asiatica]ELZ06072.1 glycoside hydrolase family 43 [Natrialba asiatica DSM 12278]